MSECQDVILTGLQDPGVRSDEPPAAVLPTLLGLTIRICNWLPKNEIWMHAANRDQLRKVINV
jgi:hypothetical protein